VDNLGALESLLKSNMNKYAKKKVCEKCKGTGFIIREDNSVDYCDCILSSKDSLLKAMNIPKRYWKIADSMDAFYAEDQDGSYTNAYIAVLDYVNKFKENEGRGLIFMGPPGVGKTYLSIFSLLYLEEKYKIRGLFYDVRSLILDLKSLIGKDRHLNSSSYEKLLTKVLKAPILVLDDLGSEILTDYNKDILTYIIASRYNDMAPIIITTNFNLLQYDIRPEQVGLSSSPSNKKQRSEIQISSKNMFEKNGPEQGKVFSYDDLPNSLKSDLVLRLGESIASRLGETCDFIYMFGEDRRINKSKKTKES